MNLAQLSAENLIQTALVFKNDNFLLAGRSLVYCFNLEAQDKLKFLEDAYPVHVEFNSYFKQFVVVTKFDVRVYKPTDGLLDRVFTSVLPQNENLVTQITSYCLGTRGRKFYVGDNTGKANRRYNYFYTLGCVVQYTMDNATLLREVNQVTMELPCKKTLLV